ncbi:hypothetical protein B0I35DRAFT_413882 [Stachybotrys elegans]|uniref:Uncharacterized protein n=1 Tax=Stachybotrys elegans TaxID=80388 RepID=A0A8K0SJ50_9HYPO|nr:hypothetical protein B0I35DRAFT_413882 [Stachybotrys elegans]
MQLSKSLALASLAALACAAPTESNELNTLSRRQHQEEAQGYCRGNPHREGHPFRYIMVFSEFGTIGTGGDPEIDNNGHVWVLNGACDIIGDESWNGGRGAVVVPFDGALEEEESISGWFANGALLNTWERPAAPTDVLYFINGEHTPGDDTGLPEAENFVCGESFSSQSFPAVYYWRICSFKPVCDVCEY